MTTIAVCIHITLLTSSSQLHVERQYMLKRNALDIDYKLSLSLLFHDLPLLRVITTGPNTVLSRTQNALGIERILDLLVQL